MTHTYTSKTDCSLEDLSGNEVGLTLIRKNGIPLYEESDDPALSQQFFTGEPGYAHFPPEKEIQIGQADYRGGFGPAYYNPDDVYRYRSSKGVDARFRGGLLPGPLPVAIAHPSAASATKYLEITNPDMEVDGTWSGGARSDTEAYNGTYSWLVTGTAAYQDIPSAKWTAGHTYVFTAYGRSVVASEGRIGIDDGVGITYGTTSFSTSAWNATTVTRTLDGSATRLRLLFDRENAASAYFDEVELYESSSTDYTPGVNYTKVDFNSKLYFGFGPYLAKLNDTGNGFTAVACFPQNIVSLKAMGDYLYIAQGTDHCYYYMETDETMHRGYWSAGAGDHADFFQLVGVTMWAGQLPNLLRSSTNPSAPTGADAWSTTTTVGETGYNIEELTEKDETLYIHKEEGDYYLDSDGNPQVLNAASRVERTSDSGKNAIVFADHHFIPRGTGSLLEDGVNNISPSLFTTNDSEFDGQVQALACDATFGFAAVDNATKIEVLAFREETVPNSEVTTGYRWHPIAEITLTGAEHMYVSSVFKKRLWISSTSTGNSIYYVPVPASYGNVAGDADMSFKSGGYLETVWYYANMKGDSKTWIKITVQTADGDATNYYEVHYKKWGDAAWTDIGDFGKTTDTTTAYIPVDGSANKPESEYIKFKIVCVSDGAQPAPILINWDCRGIWYAPERKLIALKAKVADRITIKGSIDEGQVAGTMKSRLDSMRWPTTPWPVTFYPPGWASSSDTVSVKLISPYKVSISHIEKLGNTTNIEYEVDLTMEVVTLS